MGETAQDTGLYRLRILHISDLHERGPRDKEPWRKRRMFGDAWDRNVAELMQDGPFDLICFTGDIADWGLAEEYAKATDFCQGLLERLRVPTDRLFVIPGNHDILRKVQKNVWRKMRMQLAAGVDPLDFSTWMGGVSPSPPPGMKSKWREQILAREATYRQWVHDILKRPELAPDGLGYRVSVQSEKWPFPIHVLGLDTAWLCGDDSDATRLHLTDSQLMRHATTSEGKLLNGLRLILMHHPFHELADGAQMRSRVAEVGDLVLRGHLHQTQIETWTDPDRKVRQAAAGCLYEGHRADQYPNACQAITVECNAQGRLVRIALRFRAWSPGGGHWFDDNSLYRETKGGSITWIIEQTPIVAKAENPYSPWNADPSRFVCRKQLLNQLENALEKNRSVSLVGDWRMGKSLLLKAWQARIESQGRTAKLVNGQEAEGASVSAFVGGITGTAVPDDADKAASKLEHWSSIVADAGPPVLLVDEVDTLIKNLGLRFFVRLAGILDKVVLVLASRRSLDPLMKKQFDASPLLGKLEIQWVSLLESAEQEEMIARGKKHLTSQDEGLMRRWAGRHVFYLELLGYFLIAAHQNGQMPDQAVDQFRMQATGPLSAIWNDLNTSERSALLSSANGIPNNRLSLRQRGLITESGGVFGEVLSEWIKEEV